MLLIRYHKVAIVTLCLTFLLLVDVDPGHSGVTSSLSLTGQASGIMALDGSGSGASDCTVSGGGIAMGASWTTVPTDQGSANGTFNFGALNLGDGTTCTATLGLRVRSNAKCHISASVNRGAATIPSAPKIQYQGSNINNAADLCAAIGLNNTAAIAGGANANVSSYSNSGTLFTSSNTLANLTNAASPVTGSTKFCSFTSAPSTGGTLASSNNYVEVYPQFTTQTGTAWGTASGAPSSPFAITVVFGLFAN